MAQVYTTDKIRNVALLGHSGSGKTSLAEVMLFNSGAINRQGKIEEGNTVSDHEEEEIRRNISIFASVIPIEWADHKINLIDTPGYLDFVGEVISSLNAADMALLVLDGVSGVEVGTLLAWKQAVAMNIPRAIIVNKMDRENASYRKTLNELREKLEATFVPMQYPIRQGETFAGLVDLMTGTARTGAQAEPGEIPADIADEVEAFQVEMVEAAAEGDDELMMKYFDGEELTQAEIALGLQQGLKAGTLVPVFCGSATENVGIRALMNAILSTFPAPELAVSATKVPSGEDLDLTPDAAGDLVFQIFKTADDQYGSVSFFKILSGKLDADTRVYNVNAAAEERIGQIFWPRGKEQISTSSLVAGDIGAAVKLGSTKTGDTLCAKTAQYKTEAVQYPDPLYATALHPQTQSDAGKLGPVLQRLTNADPTLQTRWEGPTKQTLLEGMGETHIDIAVKRMASYGLNVDLSIPKVPYMETMTKTNNARYRHKKQSGGAGQFGEVELRLEPQERGDGFDFGSEIFGGAISSSYLPSVEKGIKQVLDQGILAGYQVVDVKAVAVDGKEHPVDSKDIAFQIAGREAFKQAFMGGGPILLEPMMELTINLPEAFTGDVMGDLSTKRGQVQGMEQIKGETVITAIVPLSEIQRYTTDLRSLTQGQGLYAQKLSHYQQVPSHIVQEIIDASKNGDEE